MAAYPRLGRGAAGLWYRPARRPFEQIGRYRRSVLGIIGPACGSFDRSYFVQLSGGFGLCPVHHFCGVPLVRASRLDRWLGSAARPTSRRCSRRSSGSRRAGGRSEADTKHELTEGRSDGAPFVVPRRSKVKRPPVLGGGAHGRPAAPAPAGTRCPRSPATGSRTTPTPLPCRWSSAVKPRTCPKRAP